MQTTGQLLTLMADCFNHEHQSRSSDESADVLASLARRMASCIEDRADRDGFVDVATMSGLRNVDPFEEKVRHTPERELRDMLRSPHRYTPREQDIIEACLREHDEHRAAALRAGVKG